MLLFGARLAASGSFDGAPAAADGLPAVSLPPAAGALGGLSRCRSVALGGAAPAGRRCGRRRRERLVRALLIKVQDHVGAILRVGQAGEGHLGARRELARAGQPRIELVEAPFAALGLERVGEGEPALARRDRFADRAVQVRADAVGAALR